MIESIFDYLCNPICLNWQNIYKDGNEVSWSLIGCKFLYLCSDEETLFCIFVPTKNLPNFVSFWFVSFPHTDGMYINWAKWENAVYCRAKCCKNYMEPGIYIFSKKVSFMIYLVFGARLIFQHFTHLRNQTTRHP